MICAVILMIIIIQISAVVVAEQKETEVLCLMQLLFGIGKPREAARQRRHRIRVEQRGLQPAVSALDTVLG